MEINSNHSTYGAAFRQKPIFFMSGKETVAFFEGGQRCRYGIVSTRYFQTD